MGYYTQLFYSQLNFACLAAFVYVLQPYYLTNLLHVLSSLTKVETEPSKVVDNQKVIKWYLFMHIL